MFKQSQAQKMSQKAVPLIVQKQNLLMLTNLALENLIKQEIEQNPFLEETSDANDEQAEGDLELPSESKSQTDEESEIETGSKDDEFDMDDFMDEDLEGYKTEITSSSEEARNFIFENLYSTSGTLSESLLTQLYLKPMAQKLYFVGEILIDSIDDDGYIRMELRELVETINEAKLDTEFKDEEISNEEVKLVWDMIRTFDPIGIASQNLQQCLITQILTLENIDDEIKGYCVKVLTDFLEDLRLRRYENLMRSLNIDNSIVNEIFEIISSLNPKPGISSDISPGEYINPDFVVTNLNGEFKVELTDKNLPSLKLNSSYINLLKKGKNNIKKDTKEFVKTNYEKAKWFIDAINSRRTTMLKVMNYILDKQKVFFESNGKHFNPMYEKELADSIKVDISTISRAVNGKYVQTDFGIFELKSFFSNSITSEEGDTVSTKEIKNKIIEIIKNENKSMPLTDDELTNELMKEGYKISRRTVTKYREALNLPKARLRRKI